MTKLDDLLEKQRLLEENPVPTPAVDLTLVEQVQESLFRSKELESEISVDQASVQSENHRLQYDVYREKIRALEDERDRLMQVFTDVFEKERDKKQKEIDDLYVVVNQVKRIIDFLQVDKTRDLAINDDGVKARRDGAKVNLGYIFDDDFLKIKLFIAENDKPKNKYTLLAIGRCLFADHLLKLRREYGSPIHTGFGLNLEVVLREAPSVEELITWQARSVAGKVFSELKGDYEKIKAEYLDVIENYTPHDFKELITDLCGCGYFYTIFTSLHRPNGVASCPRCQQNMERQDEVKER